MDAQDSPAPINIDLQNDIIAFLVDVNVPDTDTQPPCQAPVVAAPEILPEEGGLDADFIGAGYYVAGELGRM